MVMLDWGYCCLDPDAKLSGERIGHLWLPYSAAPYYEMWINTKTLGLDVDGRGNVAHEAAFPSVILASPYEWWIAYSSTLWPIEADTIVLGVIKSAMPLGPPFEVRHRSMFVSGRNAWSPTLIRIGGKLWLYTNDLMLSYQYVTIRQPVYDSQTIGAGTQIVLIHPPGGEVGMTDVAVGADGTVWALVGQNPQAQIGLWRSSDGLTFERVRSFSFPDHKVMDGGFLRGTEGELIEPMVVFGNSIRGDMFDEWRLVWWAEPGAQLPRSLTGCWAPRPPRPRIPRGDFELKPDSRRPSGQK